MSTVHCNSPRDALARLETMTLMAGMELPISAIRQQISSALHLIVHQNRLRDGSRRITSITEVQRIFKRQGIDKEGNVIGEHTATGVRPLFMDILEAEGYKLSADVFMPPSR